MTHQLPGLPYAYNALEPHIDELTVRIHHDKHHATYVNNLNAALVDYPELQSLAVDALLSQLAKVPESIRTAVRNNGGGHANHTLYWETMAPSGGDGPVGQLAEAINSTFGSLAGLKEALSKAALTRFGSGWAWLVVDADGKLLVTSTANQDSPLSDGQTPILALDVWEHAYYLKHQNKRPDYVAAWWNVVNWERVNANYLAAIG